MSALRRLAASAAGLLLGCSCALATGLQPGYYEGLMLAVDPSGRVTGYFHEQQGQPVAKSCIFFLAGQLRGRRAAVSTWTWSDAVLPGEIEATAQGVLLRLPQGQEHAGCGLVLPPQAQTGLALDKVRAAGWHELRRIVAQRARLRAAPGGGPGRAYLVCGDVVGVLDRRGDWLHVEYRSGQRSTRGWLAGAAAAALEPPR